MLCSFVFVVFVASVDDFPCNLEEFWFVVAYVNVGKRLYNALMSFSG